MQQREAEFLIIGGGIAGISAGAWLARAGLAIVLERESQPGYHATGRSAALYTEHYGNAVVRALTRASGRFLRAPPPGFCEHPIFSERELLFIARSDQMDRLLATGEEMQMGGGSPHMMSWPEARARVPILAFGYGAGALLDPDAMDIDVHSLLQGYLRALRQAGGVLIANAEVSSLEHSGGLWRATTGVGRFTAPVLVNAAGAWADRIAEMAGLPPLHIVPLRRSAAIVDAPSGLDCSSWPMVNDVEEQFYLKAEAGRILISPADETPSPPCDAQAEDLDIAVAVDRIEQATTLRIRRIGRRWAGLRSFTSDRIPIAGFDPLGKGFFWLAGQGGYGIQTSAALGRIAAALAIGGDLPEDIAAEGLAAADLSPMRLR